MRRPNLYKITSLAVTATMLVSMCGCSAKQSADSTETSTGVITKEETEASTTDADTSSNDVDTSSNDVIAPESEPETEESELSSTEETEETEEETEEAETTVEKTTAKETTAKETSTAEETTTVKETQEQTTEAQTEAETEVTVQSVSAVVNGTHYVGETLTGADFTVTVTMSDGTVLTNPAGWGANPLTLSSTSNLLTVSYGSASITITVYAETVPETTVNVVEATTAATTVAQTTTVAPTTQAATTATTTAAETSSESTIEWVEWEDGDWNYAFAQALFIAQNEMRAEAGVDALTWDDQIYEVSKQCAKVCGDAGVVDHSLTQAYNVSRIAYNGETIQVEYSESLQSTAYHILKTDDISWYASTAAGLLNAIKNSESHYSRAICPDFDCGAIAVYKMGERTYICYHFYNSDEDDFYLNNTVIWP